MITAAANRAKPEISTLTGLRFWLAASVMLFHQTLADGPASDLFRSPYTRIFYNGRLAVTAFFCLSGFVLAYNYVGRMGTAEKKLQFFASRVARIYPAYFLALMLYIAPAVDEVHLGTHGVAESLRALFFSLLLLQAFIPSALFWNIAGWTLSDEFFFYFTLLFYAAPLERKRNWSLLGWLFLAVVVSAVFSIACMWMRETPAAVNLGGGRFGGIVNTLSFNPTFHVAEFFAGYCTGLLYARRGAWSPAVSILALLASALLIELGCVLLPQDVTNSGVFLIPLLVFIYAITNPGALLRYILGNPVSHFLGEASYGMYIYHIPLVSYIKFVDGHLLKLDYWHRHPHPMLVVYFIVVVAFSSIALVCMEQPLRKRLAPRIGQWLQQKIAKLMTP